MKGQKTFIFIAETPLLLSKDNAKIRLSERNGNLFTFPSVRILFIESTSKCKIKNKL